MEEEIEILRLTSSRADVDYDEQYWRFRNLTVLPRPIQQPIPIWVTAGSAEDVQTSLAMIRGYSRKMGHELKADVVIYHNINSRKTAMGRSLSPSSFSTAITRSITARTCSGSG